MKDFKRHKDDSWNFKTTNTKEYTHCYHIYPAMMIPQIARRLMKEYRPEGRFELLFDPYCGSGTSLVEASLQGVSSVGFDLNPLARFMAKVKTTKYNVPDVLNVLENITEQLSLYSREDVVNTSFERISNYSFWYSEDVLYRLSYLSQVIDRYASETSGFFNVVLSEVVREVSFTRNGEFKRYRMSDESMKGFNPDVFMIFEEKAKRNISGLEKYLSVVGNATSYIYDCDSTCGIPENVLRKESVDMIVTSPPYGDSRTTVAYGQFSRWANEWFGFEHASNLDSILMGGKKCGEEHFNVRSVNSALDEIRSVDEKRYWEVVSFLNDYACSIEHVSSVVRNGGVVCYVVGNRNVKGVQIPLDFFTVEMFGKFGFEHVDTIVREIPSKRMPSKTSPSNVPGKKVDTMSNEYIVIMKKTC